MNRQNPICVALDTADFATATSLARSLEPYVGFLKIGLEFFCAHGARGYEVVAATGVPIFLDLKLHDIPNTVSAALRALMQLSPRPAIVNIHASGGLDMMRAALDAVAGQSKLIAVTILTSLSDDDVREVGFDPALGTRKHACQLAELALAAGLDGVVCSPLDLAAIRQATSAEFLTVVPGIRPDASSQQDQKRVASPAEALAAGADILVIGRPITGARDPVAAARALQAGIHAG